MLRFLWNIGIALVSLIGLVVVAVALFLVLTPRPTNIKGCLTTEMFRVHLCPQDKTYVPLRSISKHVQNAVIVSEDSAFYQHHGFDWDEMQKSFEKDMDKGVYARGGSTITQQLAKNVYLTQEKSIFRKIREAMITVQLEKTLTKSEILEKYLNVVQFGENLYGVGPAAQFYFHKSAADLTPAEGAFLAFLLPNPKKYSQSFRQKKLTSFAGRQVRVIVDRLYRFGRITEAEYQSSLAEITSLFGSDTNAPVAEPTWVGEPTPPDQDAPPEVIGYPAGLAPAGPSSDDRERETQPRE